MSLYGINPDDVWVVEYSPLQECFHVSTLDEHLDRVYEKSVRGFDGSGYYLLGIYMTRDEADETIMRLRTSKIKPQKQKGSFRRFIERMWSEC